MEAALEGQDLILYLQRHVIVGHLGPAAAHAALRDAGSGRRGLAGKVLKGGGLVRASGRQARNLAHGRKQVRLFY